MKRLPEQGLDGDTIAKRLDAFGSNDLDWASGRCFAYVFSAGKEATAIAKQAYARFMSENPLDPTSFPSLVQMENEVVAIAAELMHCEGGVGNFTSGGTESILLAVKTAREHARTARGIDRPSIIVPDSIHPAFHKAAHYFDVDIISIPTRADFRADVEATAAAIDERTAMIVGSAPSYAQGVIDPIEALAKLAQERGLLMHVDACVGGFLLPFLEQGGHKLPPFDFRVPGVTSMSLDTHKYGYCPKGASVILYRDTDLRRHQLFSHTRWSGYGLTNATVQSSRSGAPVAGAWAVLHHIGSAGYVRLQSEVLTCTQELCRGIDNIEGLRVLGEPETALLSFASDTVDVFALVDAMRERQWYVQPQFAHGAVPKSIHLTVTPINVRHRDAFLADLATCTQQLRASAPTAPANDPLQAMAAAFASGALSIPDAIAMIGANPAQLGSASAPINRVLDSLPDETAEAVLREYFHQMYVPS